MNYSTMTPQPPYSVMIHRHLSTNVWKQKDTNNNFVAPNLQTRWATEPRNVFGGSLAVSSIIRIIFQASHSWILMKYIENENRARLLTLNKRFQRQLQGPLSRLHNEWAQLRWWQAANVSKEKKLKLRIVIFMLAGEFISSPATWIINGKSIKPLIPPSVLQFPQCLVVNSSSRFIVWEQYLHKKPLTFKSR